MRYPFSPSRSGTAWRILWVGTLVLSVRVCLGVDPLPEELRSAPRTKQMEYVRRMTEESRRQRAEVAAKRYEEDLGFRQSVAAGLAQQLDARRQEMFGTTGPAAVPTPGAEEQQSGQELATGQPSNNLKVPLLLLLLLVLVYRSRERLLRRF